MCVHPLANTAFRPLTCIPLLQVLVTIMAGVGSQPAYAVREIQTPSVFGCSYVSPSLLQTDIIAAQKIYLNQSYNFVCEWICGCSTVLT